MNTISELLLNFLLNATWQILAITIVVTVGARLLKDAPARYRHALWVAALCLSVALPLWSVFGIDSKAALPTTAPVSLTRTQENIPSPAVTTAVEPANNNGENGSLATGNLLAKRRHEV